MYLIFLIIALLGVLVLTVHLTLEMNSLDREIDDLSRKLTQHYGLTQDIIPDK